jgi:ParB-like chromosome segregation protein Spo0J
MELQIVDKDIKALIPYANNPKDHPEEQVVRLVSSIKEFGFINPVVVDGEDVVVAGHGRLEAAKRLKMETVPTVCVDHLTEAQVKAFRIMDNKAAESGWLDDQLKIELEGLQALGLDMELTGFSLDDFTVEIPDDNKDIDEGAMADTENECPKCGFEW